MQPSIEHKVGITPSPRLFGHMGKQGIQLWDAAADLTDNCLDARIEGKPVTVTIDIVKDEETRRDAVLVIDNGKGMNRHELQHAITLAQSDKAEDATKHGQYGLGMKQACLGVGRRFSITTKPQGSTKTYRVVLDEDLEEWEATIYEQDVGTEEGHGTQIVITDLRSKPHNKIPELKANLRKRFSRFMQGNPNLLRLKVLGDYIEPVEETFNAEFGDNGKAAIDITIEACYDKASMLMVPYEADNADANWDLGTKKTIRAEGWVGVLQEGKVQYSAFDTYRHGRAITLHDWDWIDGGYHPTRQRMRGELTIHGVEPDITKRAWDEDSWEYQMLREAVQHHDAVLAARAFDSAYRKPKTINTELQSRKATATAEKLAPKDAQVRTTTVEVKPKTPSKLPAPETAAGAATPAGIVEIPEEPVEEETPTRQVLTYRPISIGSEVVYYRQATTDDALGNIPYRVTEEFDGILIEVSVSHASYRSAKDPATFQVACLIDACSKHVATLNKWSIEEYDNARWATLVKAS